MGIQSPVLVPTYTHLFDPTVGKASKRFGSDPTSGFALYLDFRNGIWRGSSGRVAAVSSLPGYSSTRAGTELRLSSAGAVTSFAANTPAIISGDGYFSQAAVTNLMLQSQDATNASWTKPPVFTGDVVAAPDGTITADQIGTNSTTATDNYQLKTLTAVPYTLSRFVKKDGSGTRWAYLFAGNGANALAFFDLTNGVVGTVSGSALVKSARIIALPNGWYWIMLTATATATSVAYGSGWSSIDATPTYANGVGGYVWQAQLVLGSDPGPLIPTTTTSVASVQPVLSFTVPNGTYTEVTTFDDGSTQTRTPTVSGNTYTAPVYPTVLNRLLARSITLHP